LDFGLMIFPTDYAVPPAQLARAAEERGFESLFFPEHTHIPASRETPYPAGGDLPPEYWHTHDPFVALASAAAVTEKLRVATVGAPTDRAELDAYERAGVTRAVFWLRSQPLADLDGRLDRCAELAATYAAG